MSRKFVTEREIAFINSITRELHQHVVDEEVMYYSIDLQQTEVHRLYNEAVKKTWLPPVKITARVLYENLNSVSNQFGIDSQFKLEVYFHRTELDERHLQPREGDYIEYGQQVYEITSVSESSLVFGQINNKLMVKCTCVPSREQQFQIGGQSDQGKDNTHPITNAKSIVNPTKGPP